MKQIRVHIGLLIALVFFPLVLTAQPESPQLELEKQVDFQQETVGQLKEQRLSAEKIKQEANRSQKQAEKDVKLADSVHLRELAEAKVLLEKTRAELAEKQIEWIGELESRTKKYKEKTEEISNIFGNFLSLKTDEEKRERFHEINSIWRQAVDETFSYILNPPKGSLPNLPELPQKLLEVLKSTAEANEYKKIREDLGTKITTLREKRSKHFEEDQLYHQKLLVQSSQVRSILMDQYFQEDISKIYEDRNIYLKDLWREIHIIPYKWIALFFVKFFEAQQKIKSGWIGVFRVLLDFGLALLVIGIPLVLFKKISKLTHFINERCSLILKQRKIQLRARQYALWLTRTNPYIPWLITLIGFYLYSQFFVYIKIDFMNSIIPYIYLYCLYRIFRLLISHIMARLVPESFNYQSRKLRERIEKTAQFLGIFFLIVMCLLYATGNIVGKALAYHLVSIISLYLTGFFILLLANSWSVEISKNIENLSPKILTQYLSKAGLGRFKIIYSFISLLYVAIILAINFILNLAMNLDIFKRISAKIFRKRLESLAEKNDNESHSYSSHLTSDYINLFDADKLPDSSLIISTDHEKITHVKKEIRGWLDGNVEEHSLAIYGEKGIGKSTFLNILEDEFKDYKILKTQVPPKLITKNEVINFFSSLLGIDSLKGPISLAQGFENKEKSIIILDDAHNLFLAKYGGFEGFKCFLNLINAQVDNIYWIVAFNTHAYSYLNQVHGENQYFAETIFLDSWSDVEIKDLILLRHKKTDYQLSYEDIVIALRNSVADQDVLEDTESRYFNLLWEASRGIPKTALRLWISALKPYGSHSLKVGLPEEIDAKDISTLPDETLFVLASIVRHENLSMQEVMKSTDLPRGVIQYALKVCLERDLLEKSIDNRYRISPVAYSSVEKQLITRNFIYGI
jgi:ABC-type multidrug transport system fused ATPase/permease subunit